MRRFIRRTVGVLCLIAPWAVTVGSGLWLLNWFLVNRTGQVDGIATSFNGFVCGAAICVLVVLSTSVTQFLTWPLWVRINTRTDVAEEVNWDG